MDELRLPDEIRYFIKNKPTNGQIIISNALPVVAGMAAEYKKCLHIIIPNDDTVPAYAALVNKLKNLPPELAKVELDQRRTGSDSSHLQTALIVRPNNQPLIDVLVKAHEAIMSFPEIAVQESYRKNAPKQLFTSALA